MTRGRTSRMFPSCASSPSAPAAPAFKARSSDSALSGVTSVDRICPPSSPISMRTKPLSATGYHLRKDAVHCVWMDESDLEPEQSCARRRIDDVRAGSRQPLQLGTDIADLVGDVVHALPTAREKATDRTVLLRCGEQLDAPLSDAEEGRLDALVVERSAMLELRTELAAVGGDRLVEIG